MAENKGGIIKDPTVWVLVLAIVGLLGVAVFLIGGYATGRINAYQSATPVSAAAGANGATLNLAIVASGISLGPAYVPSSFSVPADSTVKVTVTDFDNATPLTGPLTQFAKVTGTVGNVMEVQSINPAAPNAGVGVVRTMSRINPNLVAHTLTIPQLHLNIPIAAQSRVTFLLHTGKPGSYSWECMDPCGGGATGEGAPMGVTGYMAGTMTVSS